MACHLSPLGTSEHEPHHRVCPAFNPHSSQWLRAPPGRRHKLWDNLSCPVAAFAPGWRCEPLAGSSWWVEVPTVSLTTVSAMPGSCTVLSDPCLSVLLDFKLHEGKKITCFITVAGSLRHNRHSGNTGWMSKELINKTLYLLCVANPYAHSGRQDLQVWVLSRLWSKPVHLVAN